MIPLLILAKYTLIAIILLTTILCYYIVMLPILKLYPYKRKGAKVYYFPIIGGFKPLITDFRTRDDLFASSREVSQYFPDQKYWISNISSQTMITLNDPQYVKEFIQKQTFYKKASFIGPLAILGTGLVFAESEKWKRHRKIISNSFHYEFLKRNINTMQSTTQEFLNKINKDDYENFPVICRIQEITGEIIGRIFFGEKLSSFTYEGKPLTLALTEVLSELAECASTPLVNLFGTKALYLPIIPQYKRLMDKVRGIRGVCAKIIQAKKANPNQSEDLLGLLLSTQKSEEPEQRFSDDDIINEFVTFFSAGMDSTGHLIALTLYNLTQYPQFIPILKEEIESIYNSEAAVSADILQKMNFLHSVLKETLRFHTPFPGLTPREAVKDHTLFDLDVKKGTILRFDFLSMFFNEKYFENPNAFDPSRWTRNEPKNDFYAYIPFSAGARNCIGQHLAIMESKIIIAEFLKRFQLNLKEGYRLRMIFRFTYEPYEDILLNLTPIIPNK